MAIELGHYGIRTNNVNPTVVLTRMGKIAWSDPKKSGPILRRIPLERFAGEYDEYQLTAIKRVNKRNIRSNRRNFVCEDFLFVYGEFDQSLKTINF